MIEYDASHVFIRVTPRKVSFVILITDKDEDQVTLRTESQNLL